MADGRLGEGEEGFAGEGDGAGDAGGGRQEAEDGKRGGGFAGAGLADEAEGLAGSDVEGDAVDDGGRGAEGEGEVADVEQGGHWVWSIIERSWGLRLGRQQTTADSSASLRNDKQ